MTHSFTPTPQPRREPVQESHWVLWSVLAGVAFWPRLWILAFWIFGRQIGDAFDGWIVPALGFLLLPWTTLLYAWMWAVTSDGVTGWEWSLVSVAFLLDIWFWVAGRRSLKS